MSDEQETGSEEEPVAKKLVTVDRLTRDRQRRDGEISKADRQRSTEVNVKLVLGQLYIVFRIFGCATVLCLILGIMSIFIPYTDIPFLADFGFLPFTVCLIAYAWLKVAWIKIRLNADANATIKGIQDQVDELRSRA